MKGGNLMFNRIIWPIMMVVSSLMVIIFIFGFAKVMNITGAEATQSQENDEASSESIIEESNLESDSIDGSAEKVILTIGDSIGASVGDERNMGIGERYVTMQAYEVRDLYEVINFSVPGAQTNNLQEQVMSGEIDEAIVASDLIIVSIGGNNLNRIRNSDASMLMVEFEEKLSEHLDDLEKVLTYIGGKNSDAEIVVLGLYNPFGDDANNEDVRLVQEWNYQTRLAVMEVENSHIIPLYDLFADNLELLLSIDDFHPSGEGYERIARMVDEVINWE